MDTAPLQSPNLRESLAWVICDIHAKGWARGTGGNFSAVQGRDPLVLLMAPSGIDKGLVKPADLIAVNHQGTVINGSGKASAETFLHLAIVEETGATAVLHTHSVFNTLLSELYAEQGQLMLAGYEMLKGLEGVRTHETSVAIPILANAQDMAKLSQQVRCLLDSSPPPYGFLLAGHGLYTWGDSLFQAKRHLEILEFLFELTYRKLTLLRI
jgi:methylthioribulose-1-phosphate dehydratase